MTMLLRALFVALFASILAGCAATRLQEPHLSVVDVNLVRGDLLKQELRVRMSVQNPNDRALPVKGLNYRVELAGEQFAEGESMGEFVVPAKGETEFDLKVNANLAAALLQMIGGASRRGQLDYRISGSVHLASGWMRHVPFDETGVLKLR
jgi:LEA14-like dessication related protein